MELLLRCLVVLVAGCGWCLNPCWGEGLPVVEAEEVVYRYTAANNGAGPMWCAGSTSLVRVGEAVFVTGLETMADAAPLNNCRWVLFQRGETEWERVFIDSGRTREPAPMAVLKEDTVVVSGNPTFGFGAEPNGGPARPELKLFDAQRIASSSKTEFPTWDGAPGFREHSYRSLAADGTSGEAILFQNIGYTHAEWTFRDGSGEFSKFGRLKWPIETRYQPVRPLRLCYPNVGLMDRAVHFFGVGDIVEPVSAWRDFKTQLTGRQWDYVFRELHYCFTPDITREDFGSWVRITSRESTAGAVWPCDLWLETAERAHLLWTERAIDERLRDRFYPEAKQVHSLHYAIVENGKVVQRRVVMQRKEGQNGLIANRSRFHIGMDGQLWVVSYVSGTGKNGQPVSENRIMRLNESGHLVFQFALPLDRPFTNFFTATPRAGCQPSPWLDLFGTQVGGSNEMAYARVRMP